MPKYHANQYHDKIKSVKVNGVVIPRVFFVDTDHGVATAHATRNGVPFLESDGKLACQTHVGTIELEWMPGFGPGL